MPTPLTIARIQTTPFRLAMHGALQWGKTSALAEARHVLVEVELSDGAIGYAEAPPRPTIYGETVYSITSVIEHELAPRLSGRTAYDPARDGAPQPWRWPSLLAIQARLHETKNNHTAKGSLDMALHAAIAQHRGLDLAAHLGATQQELTASYILGIGDRATVLAEAQRVVAAGVRVLKVKVGRTWEDDLARIAELQTTLGPEVRLYADANECLEPDEAPVKLAQLAELGLLYCEEPLPVELIRERAALCRGVTLPIIADDSAFSLRDLRRELALDTFDILNIKTARTGFTESGAMLDLALQAGKGVMVGSQASAGLGTAHAAIFAALAGIDHPAELAFGLKLKEDIVTPRLPIHNGKVRLADVLRVHVAPDLLAAARV